MRPSAARAHPSLHAESAARRNRAGDARRLHALSVRWQHVDPADKLTRARRSARGDRDARRLRAGASRMGTRDTAGAPRALRPAMLDMLCLAGEVGWARLLDAAADPSIPPGWCRQRRSRCFCASTPRSGRRCARHDDESADRDGLLGDRARRVLETLTLAAPRSSTIWWPPARSMPTPLRQAHRALVAAGLVASDGFSGLRALMSRGAGSVPSRDDRRANFAGRWTRARGQATRRASRRPSRRSRGRCCAATASSSGGC